MYYQYKTITVRDGWFDIDELNKLGLVGWKVISTTQFYLLLMKEF